MSRQWIQLEHESQVTEAIQASYEKPVVLFKHSTRCSISSVALSRINSSSAEICRDVECYFLDLLKFRNISDNVSETLDVEHASPQIIVIKNGVCVYDASHNAIRPEEIRAQLNTLS